MDVVRKNRAVDCFAPWRHASNYALWHDVCYYCMKLQDDLGRQFHSPGATTKKAHPILMTSHPVSSGTLDWSTSNDLKPGEQMGEHPPF